MEYTELKQLVDEGLSTRSIGERKGCSQSTVKYWLKKHNLKTKATLKEKETKEEKRRKSVIAVSNRRRKVKLLALEYKGNKCSLCGYDKYVGALEFHHTDPNQKDYNLAKKGYTFSWKRIKEELDKCILVCANCHREIHGNL